MFFEMLQRFYDWLGRQWSFVQNPADLLPHYTFPIRPSVNFDPYSWFFCASTREQLITDRTVNQSATRESCFDHGVLPEVEHDHFVYRFCHGNAYQWSCFSVIFLLRNCEYLRRRLRIQHKSHESPHSPMFMDTETCIYPIVLLNRWASAKSYTSIKGSRSLTTTEYIYLIQKVVLIWDGSVISLHSSVLIPMLIMFEIWANVFLLL